MAWNAITEADVLTTLSGAELAGYRAAALQAGQPDPVAEQIANVTNLARGYIAGWTANTLGPEGTIPDKLLQICLDILAVKIPLRVGSDPTEARAKAADVALRVLKDVSNGSFKLEVAASFTSEKIAIVTPTISHTNRHRRLRFEEGAS